MAELGIMIESQEGLTWEYWRALCRDVDGLDFASLRRSDHLFSVMERGERESLECWVSLALAAEWTKRVQIGPMVSPMTFRHPALLAKMAAAVDQLSGGRLILGVGAGWNEAEHQAFGVPFPTLKERFDNLESGIERIRQTWRVNRPAPVHGEVPLLIGGSGEKRTLKIAARDAAEWNINGATLDAYRAKSEVLAAHCAEIGRDPGSIRHSMMATYCIGRDRAELRERAGRLAEVLVRLQGKDPDAALEDLGKRGFVGTPEEIVAKMRPFVDAGMDLFMLQHFLLDDRDALRLLSEEVVPALR